MSVLETVTVDNVTYDMHDPKVGSGTLSTTAQTLIPAVNEVKSGLTTVSSKTNVIGSGSLNTTAQTIIPAINELKSNSVAHSISRGTKSIAALNTPTTNEFAVSTIATVNLKAGEIFSAYVKESNNNSSTNIGYAYNKSAGEVIQLTTSPNSSAYSDGNYYGIANNYAVAMGIVLIATADTTVKLIGWTNSARSFNYWYSVV